MLLKKSTEFLQKLNQYKGTRQTFIQIRDDAFTEKEKNEKELIIVEQAQVIIQDIDSQTKGQLKYHIEDIVSMAFEAVLDDPYKFKIDFIPKRNQTEADIKFVDDLGNEYKPMEATGGGVVDTASTALKATMWSLSDSAPFIILDEPIKFVSEDLQERATLLLKELSSKLGLQLIVVTHNPTIMNAADKMIKVVKRNKISIVEKD